MSVSTPGRRWRLGPEANISSSHMRIKILKATYAHDFLESLECRTRTLSGLTKCLQQSGNGFINSVGPKFFLKNGKVCTKTLTIHRSCANGDVSEINGDGVKDADDFVWHAHVVLVLVLWSQSQ